MNLSVVILRGFTFYGPHQKGEQLIPSIIESIKKDKPIIVNDPNPKRDYLHITDFNRLIYLILRSSFSGNEIYNLGEGNLYNNLEVAQMANGLATKSVPLLIKGEKRRNDVLECCADMTKIKKDFKWEPEVDLQSGLLDCLSC
jgi:nucleoside-diphosphate-sugar epimerase